MSLISNIFPQLFVGYHHDFASTHTHVGTSPPGYNQGWVTHTVHWHGFESLSALRGEFVYSPEFMLLGNPWCLAAMFPGGDAGAVEGMVTTFLANRSDKAIEIYYGFSVNDGGGKQVEYERSPGSRIFGPVDTGINARWGFLDFVTRSALLRSLVNGTAIIEVHMKLATLTKSVPPPFIPENPSSCKTIQGLFLDDKSSDIVFEVGADKGKSSAMKVAKTVPVTFSAHRVIIENCSRVFAELCESHDDNSSQIQINDVTPDIFLHLLNYIYGGKTIRR